MSYYAGIDVGLEYAHVCVVDGDGQGVHEGRAASAPAALVEHLSRLGLGLARVGLEAGPLAQWLFDGLATAGLAAVLIETRHFKAAQAAMRVKTDRGDARAIAQILRVGWFKPVHVKSPQARQAGAAPGASRAPGQGARPREQHPRALARLRLEARPGGRGRLRGAGPPIR